MSAITDNDNAFTYEKLVLAGQAHPTRILILRVMGEDLDTRWSASDMTDELRERGHKVTLGAVSYHFRTLAAKRWLVKAGHQRVRGAIESFYRVDGRRV